MYIITNFQGSNLISIGNQVAVGTDTVNYTKRMRCLHSYRTSKLAV